jgi:hypothetical protein
MIDFDIENELRPNLSKDEKLLWTARPQTGIKFQTLDIFMIPFSLLWTGTVFSMFLGPFNRGNAPFLFSIFPLFFLFIGLYFIIGRFFVDIARRKNTAYGITNNRIIIKSGLLNKEVKSLNLRTLSDVTTSEKSDGSGTITLGPTDWRSSMMGNMAWPGVRQPTQFQYISNVQDVYQLIVKLQHQ